MKRNEILLIFCLVCVFLINGCKNKGNKAQDSQPSTIVYMIANQNNKYTTYLSKLDTHLTEHFPISLDTTHIQLLRGSYSGTDMDYLEVTNRISDKTVIQYYITNNIGAYAGDEPCVLAYHLFDSWKEYPKTKFNQCHINKYPIPDFRGNKYRDMGTVSRLPQDFMIYVLDSQPKNEISDSLIVSNNVLLERWEGGYSRGVAISEEKMIIIFWTIVW